MAYYRICEQNQMHNAWRNYLTKQQLIQMKKSGKITKEQYKRAIKRMRAEHFDFNTEQDKKGRELIKKYKSMNAKEKQRFKEKYSKPSSFYNEAMKNNERKTPGYKRAFEKTQKTNDIMNLLGWIPTVGGAGVGYALGGPTGMNIGAGAGAGLSGVLQEAVTAKTLKKNAKNIKDPELNKRVNKYLKD